DAKKLSRAALGLRLGISPKTIQSWEMGRTFIEDLSLIPAIEAELDISVSGLIARATGAESAVAEAPASYGSRKRAMAKAGPLATSFDIHAVKNEAMPDAEELAKKIVAVPLVKPSAVTKPVSELTTKDIIEHITIPGEWAPRGGVLIAYRMSDSGMVPIIPLGGTVIIDRRPQETDKAMNRMVALYLQSKGVRIRRLMKDPISGKVMGTTAFDSRRGKVNFREDMGDYILGRIVGILAQPE
ncbi:MAG: helix-turn-helix transcriptional regulator, partial [Planctomycetes bacterium]|nr:helix-turn-helix transcriptional regulator [Planctomycetota bacterium]